MEVATDLMEFEKEDRVSTKREQPDRYGGFDVGFTSALPEGIAACRTTSR
jgi:hypothetical protein